MYYSNRKAVSGAGWLYVIGFAMGILSVAYAVDTPDYLLKAAANANAVMIAAFFHLMMAPAYVGIAITLYPVLRQYHPHLAFGFASFRVIAGGFIILGVVFLLQILTLSQEFVRAGASGAAYFQTLGVLLQTGRDLVNHIGMTLAVSLSGLMFYAMLYQTRLVPRWLTIWGLVGTTLVIIATFLVMFRFIDIITTRYLVLTFPMALQEMVFAVWLIVKGFNPTASESRSVKTG
ncbi:MAG: DUF4386 domain-containing protein [Anaerolineaceae bacterium]|nr:DUF4386 domain-containing protein [Anaerolineaceae bacterium]